MASVTIRVHQPVLGWPSGTTHTVELTTLIQGLIDNQIAEVLEHFPDPDDAPEREDHIQPPETPADPDLGKTDDSTDESRATDDADAPAAPRRPRTRK